MSVERLYTVFEIDREDERQIEATRFGVEPDEALRDGERLRRGAFVVERPETRFLGPFFTYPFVDGLSDESYQDGTIHLALASLFDGVTAETIVRGAFYTWTLKAPEADASGNPYSPEQFTLRLVAALDATGADGQFIVDENHGSTAAIGLADPTDDRDTGRALRDLLGDRLHLDTGGPTDPWTIQHAKFLTFSRLSFAEGVRPTYPREMEYVVAVGSANVTGWDFVSANNFVVMYGNKDLYDTFVRFWNYTRDNPEATGDDAISERCGDVHVFTFPIAQIGIGTVIPDDWKEAILVSALGFPALASIWAVQELLDAMGVTEVEAVGIGLVLAGDPITGGLLLLASWSGFGGGSGAEAEEVAREILLPEQVNRMLDTLKDDPIAEAFFHMASHLFGLSDAERATAIPRVRICHAYFCFRSQLITALQILASQGADIRIVTGLMFTNDLVAVPELKAVGIPIRALPREGGPGIDGGEFQGEMHNKYFIAETDYTIDGVTRRRKLVWTGSHNLYSGSLEICDEVVVRIDDPQVFAAYEENWNKLWSIAEEKEIEWFQALATKAVEGG